MLTRLRIRPSDGSKPDLVSEWFNPQSMDYNVSIGPVKDGFIAIKIIIELQDKHGNIISPENLVIPL